MTTTPQTPPQDPTPQTPPQDPAPQTPPQDPAPQTPPQDPTPQAMQPASAFGPIPLGERDPATGALVLSAKDTVPTAQAYLREHHRYAEGLTLASYAGRFYLWEDNRYIPVDDGELRNRLQPWLYDAKQYRFDRRTGTLALHRFHCNPSTVNAALETVRNLVHLREASELPFWRSEGRGRCDPKELLPCKTATLHIPTGETLPATPDLFTFNALSFDHDPDAPEPANWLGFLSELWGEDSTAIDLLQEWFGYCLAPDTSQQKMLLLYGPKRSGKGTIGRILSELVGRENVAGPTTSSLAGPFGLQPLLGKSLAVVSDARFSGQGMQSVVERLLCVSGEDTITVDRKHLPSMTLKMPVRFTFLSNELPRLRDAAGALAGRFLILKLNQSFYGQEDPQLTEKLLAELPGVLLWALEGWERLNERGHFVTPESSREAADQLADLTSPVSAFIRECCQLSETGRVTVSELYAAWRAWCEDDGRDRINTKQQFGRELLAAAPSLRPRRNGEGRFYEGIALTSPPEGYDRETLI